MRVLWEARREENRMLYCCDLARHPWFGVTSPWGGHFQQLDISLTSLSRSLSLTYTGLERQQQQTYRLLWRRVQQLNTLWIRIWHGTVPQRYIQFENQHSSLMMTLAIHFWHSSFLRTWICLRSNHVSIEQSVRRSCRRCQFSAFER